MITFQLHSNKANDMGNIADYKAIKHNRVVAYIVTIQHNTIGLTQHNKLTDL